MAKANTKTTSNGTAIEWTHWPGFRGETWNPIRATNTETGKAGWLCSHVSPGCDNCYAEAFNKWVGTGLDYTHQNVKRAEQHLAKPEKPIRWTEPRCVFVNSMFDLFQPYVSNEHRDAVLAHMMLTGNHVFLVLTKLPHVAADYLTSERTAERVQDAAEQLRRELAWVPGFEHHQQLLAIHGQRDALTYLQRHVMVGATVEDQRRASERVTPMRALHDAGWYTFVSYEPALSAVDWHPWLFADWIIAGGESGPKARRPRHEWFMDTALYLHRFGVPFFFKQWGRWCPESELPSDVPSDVLEKAKRHAVRYDGHTYLPVGKHYSGRQLGGATFSALPEHVRRSVLGR